VTQSGQTVPFTSGHDLVPNDCVVFYLGSDDGGPIAEKVQHATEDGITMVRAWQEFMP
jgi:hypothetical protein